MQDCSQGVKNLVYDLGDAARWEYFFPSIDKQLLLPDEEMALEEDHEEVREGEKEDSCTMYMYMHIQCTHSCTVYICNSDKCT